MQNGMDMDEANFARLNEPLLSVDALWNRFAKKIDGRIICNYHGRPERRVVLRDPSGLCRAIALACVDKARDANGRPLAVHYYLDIGAYYDTDRNRTWWDKAIARLPADQINRETLEPLLAKAWDQLKDVDLEYLRTYGTIAVFPPGCAVYSKDQMVEHPSSVPEDELLN